MSLNTFAVNQSAINQWQTPAEVVQDDIVYNGFGLCNANIAIISSNDKDRNYDLNSINNSFVDWWIVLSHLVRNKVITLWFAIKADTKSELYDLIDDFKAATSKTEWLLEIKINGEYRVIPCSITTNTFDQMRYGATSVTWTITFQAVNPPRFYLKEYISKTYNNITADFNADISNSGSAKTYPVYYFIFWAGISGLDEVNIILNWYTLTINETITDGSVLIINAEVDTENGGNVTLNGAEVDFQWPLDIQLEQWSNIAEITFASWATFTCSVAILYRKMFE